MGTVFVMQKPIDRLAFIMLTGVYPISARRASAGSRLSAFTPDVCHGVRLRFTERG